MEKNPLDLLSWGLDTFMGNNPDVGTLEERKVDQYETDGLQVSTVWANDMSWYETAIAHPQYNCNKWIVVEQYGQDRDAAEKGHKEWVKVMTAQESPPELVDIDAYNIGLEPFKRDE